MTYHLKPPSLNSIVLKVKFQYECQRNTNVKLQSMDAHTRVCVLELQEKHGTWV